MRVERVVVSSQRKVPNPVSDFASISALVSLEAVIGPDDDVEFCVAKLQADAENLAERHLLRVETRMKAQERMTKGNSNAKAQTEARLEELVQKHGVQR